MSGKQISGWAMFKDGKPHGCNVEPTKRSLLIGYDMMPLRGLPKTEKVLRDKGYIARRAVVQVVAHDEPHDAIVPIIDGKLDRRLMAFSDWSTDMMKTLSTAALFFYDDNRFTADEQAALCKFFWTPSRQKVRFAQRATKAQVLLEKRGITFVPVRIKAS